MKFTAIAPDGTKITFASKTRMYTHAILARWTPEMKDRHVGLDSEWSLRSRIGRPDLISSALTEAGRYNLDHTPTKDENGHATVKNGKYVWMPLIPRCEFVVVEVTHN